METETLKKTWRPALGWATVLINLLYAGIVAAMLISGLATLSEAIPFMAAQVAQLGLVGGAAVAGRSWEKRHGMDGGSSPVDWVDVDQEPPR